MNIERSSLQTPAEFGSTSSIREQLVDSLRSSKEYRHAFLEESIGSRITGQIKGLRDAHNCDYKAFAQLINKKLSWAYRLEDPNAPPPTIPTLLEIANAFDIALDVRFCPFSQLVTEVTTLTPESFAVPSFEEEARLGSFLKKRRRRRNIRSSRLMLRKARGAVAKTSCGSINGATTPQQFAVA